MSILAKIGMNQRTTFIVTRILGLLILLYALAEIVIVILYAAGKGGYINLGIPITIIIGIGIWQIKNWARRIEIIFGLIGIGIGILTQAVPEKFSSISIYYLWTTDSVFFSNQALVIIGSILLLCKVIFLLLPSTVLLFHNAERGELPKE